MKKLLIILSMFLLVSCEWDYIHENPNHPDEYQGIWKCDSIYINGVNTKTPPIANFLELLQPSMDFNGVGYGNWMVKRDETPNKLIGYNTSEVPLITLDVVRTPAFYIDGLKLELKLDKTIYYLTNTMR